MAKKKKPWLKLLLSVLIVMFLLAGSVVGWYYYDSHVDRSGWVMQYDQY